MKVSLLFWLAVAAVALFAVLIEMAPWSG